MWESGLRDLLFHFFFWMQTLEITMKIAFFCQNLQGKSTTIIKVC